MGFRVIIIGCGPVGLAMARSLQLAGIDYVVLEKNDEIAPDMGFGIALYPQSMRLLDQFGLLDQVLEEGWHYRFKTNYSPEGKTVEDNEMMGTVKEWHGHPWQYMPRRTLLKMLHESILDRDTKIKTGKRVGSIKVHDTGVEVTCDDGTIEQGSIIMGCDGIRSIARTEMDRLERAETGRATNETKPFKIYYKALIGRSKSVEHLELNKTHETRGKHKAYQVFPSKLGCWWFAYIRVPEGHKEQRYTPEDAEAAADALRDDVVAPGGLTFGDLWDARSEGAMWDLHEGSVSKWHHKGRIVLLGDSVHKFAPTAGNGLNTGWQSVSELANLLRRELMNDQEPSSKRLEAAFKTYQSRRKPISKVAEGVSWFYLRTIVWHNPMYRCLDWMAPYLGGDMTIFKMLSKPCIRSAVVLEYVEEPNLPPSKKPWKNAQVKHGKGEEDTLGVN